MSEQGKRPPNNPHNRCLAPIDPSEDGPRCGAPTDGNYFCNEHQKAYEAEGTIGQTHGTAAVLAYGVHVGRRLLSRDLNQDEYVGTLGVIGVPSSLLRDLMDFYDAYVFDTPAECSWAIMNRVRRNTGGDHE